MEGKYPTVRWVREKLRYDWFARTREQVLNVYVIGSEARGMSKSDSDLDIAVIIKEKPNLTSIKFSERFHSKYPSNADMPKWNGKRVDFQFFYPGEIEKLGYKAIELELR